MEYRVAVVCPLDSMIHVNTIVSLISPFVEINISNYHGDGITTTFIAFRILRSLEGFLCNVINILLVLVQLKLYHFLQNVPALKKEYSTNLFIYFSPTYHAPNP